MDMGLLRAAAREVEESRERDRLRYLPIVDNSIGRGGRSAQLWDMARRRAETFPRTNVAIVTRDGVFELTYRPNGLGARARRRVKRAVEATIRPRTGVVFGLAFLLFALFGVVAVNRVLAWWFR